jgi:cysteinyl-tRNA synthetase
MKLYNTLTRNIEDIKPLQQDSIAMYSCGPTVYDNIHVGNLSSFIMADTLRRVLKASGYSVKHVMNFTDVDDKTIRRSHEKYSSLDPHEALRKLTTEYTDIFLHDMRRIGNDVDSFTFVRATDCVESMKNLISRLHEAGFAYVADDGVYFSIEAYRRSGKKYGQLLEITSESTAEARIQNDEYDKDSAHDFALWKKQKAGEPSWEFMLDNKDLSGRPGWHIECSVMSRDNLGQPFDIHTGGVDLIFPHHENEIAQSTALEENPIMARAFVHNEHLLVDGKKMSKSLQNFYTLEDVIAKGYDPLAFRLMILQAHYRNQTNFTWESLKAAQNRLNDIYAWADLRHQPQTDTMPDELDQLFKSTREAMQAALEDDLNTPEALSTLSRLMNYMGDIAIPGVEGTHTDGMLAYIENVLGIPLTNRPDITDDQKHLIKERQTARDNKDWAKSDELRDRLKEQGIGVRDTAFGPIWTRL